MLLVYFHGVTPSTAFESLPLSTGVSEVLKEVGTSLTVQDVYFINNGKRITIDTPVLEGVVHVCPRLKGGKGGFGSMLRAIGAQIEKTTNREACRDLSGRRLRDINEEQRMKSWVAKKAEREREAAERKRKKLEKLRAEPKHDFTDKKYEEERSKLTSDVSSAIEKGFQSASSAPGPSKGASGSNMRKGFMLEEEEISSGSSESDSDEVDAIKSEAQQPLMGQADSSDSEESTTSEHLPLTVKSVISQAVKRLADSSDSDESITKRQRSCSHSSSSFGDCTSESGDSGPP